MSDWAVEVLEKKQKKLAKLEMKIQKQKLILSNYKAWGRKPPWFYISNLNNWEQKRIDILREIGYLRSIQ